MMLGQWGTKMLFSLNISYAKCVRAYMSFLQLRFNSKVTSVVWKQEIVSVHNNLHDKLLSTCSIHNQLSYSTILLLNFMTNNIPQILENSLHLAIPVIDYFGFIRLYTSAKCLSW